MEPGESLDDAVAREVLEETGLRILSARPILQEMCEGEVTFWTTCYLVSAYDGEPMSREEGIAVSWVSWADLVSDASPFHRYNKRVYVATLLIRHRELMRPNLTPEEQEELRDIEERIPPGPHEIAVRETLGLPRRPKQLS